MTMCGRGRTLFLTAALAPDLESLMSGRTYMLMTCHGLTAINVHERGGDYRWCPPCNAGSHGRCRRSGRTTATGHRVERFVPCAARGRA